MVIVLNRNHSMEKEEKLMKMLETKNIKIHKSVDEKQPVLGLMGDTSSLNMDSIRGWDIVKEVKRISEPYKAASRSFQPSNTIVQVGDAIFGGCGCPVIAGPCSVESKEQILEVAHKVKAAGATLLRGGAFKPRTSPYAFQGLQADGIQLLLEAKKETGLPIVSELMDLSQLDLFDEVDVIQIGARNMQNFELLRQVGKTQKTILLKRGLANTLQEFLMSAEYILHSGNHRVILCERGIRTFEPATRNTLDLSAIPLLHQMTHLPVIVDPSHASGIANLVKPMAMAAVACGADGLMIEVHNDPAHALCDGAQSLTPEAFQEVMTAITPIMPIAYKAV